MPQDVPASWYAAELPPAQSAALKELQRAHSRAKHAGAAAARDDAAAVHTEGDSPPWRHDAADAAAAPLHDVATADAEAAWHEWRRLQAAYSYWWWRWAALGALARPRPWAVPPRAEL